MNATMNAIKSIEIGLKIFTTILIILIITLYSRSYIDSKFFVYLSILILTIFFIVLVLGIKDDWIEDLMFFILLVGSAILGGYALIPNIQKIPILFVGIPIYILNLVMVGHMLHKLYNRLFERGSFKR